MTANNFFSEAYTKNFGPFLSKIGGTIQPGD